MATPHLVEMIDANPEPRGLDLAMHLNPAKVERLSPSAVVDACLMRGLSSDSSSGMTVKQHREWLKDHADRHWDNLSWKERSLAYQVATGSNIADLSLLESSDPRPLHRAREQRKERYDERHHGGESKTPGGASSPESSYLLPVEAPSHSSGHTKQGRCRRYSATLISRSFRSHQAPFSDGYTRAAVLSVLCHELCSFLCSNSLLGRSSALASLSTFLHFSLTLHCAFQSSSPKSSLSSCTLWAPSTRRVAR